VPPLISFAKRCASGSGSGSGGAQRNSGRKFCQAAKRKALCWAARSYG
jgi:hypothetical protein